VKEEHKPVSSGIQVALVQAETKSAAKVKVTVDSKITGPKPFDNAKLLWGNNFA
tara:strand:+ start:1485 stop:1646 length:162 start_codon:yes stop_codon:yes gene_type:complete